MTAGPAAAEWFLLSDLHLDGRPSPRDRDGALVGFLETVVRGRPSGGDRARRALVLLGDTLDLTGPSPVPPRRVADRMTALARRHRPVFAALGRCVQDGVELHVVAGNHDVEVVRPDASALLVRLLGLRPEPPGVRFWPWLLHVPGVLYAEHGNQHHTLNRNPAVLRARAPVGADGPLPPPPLGAASADREWCDPAGLVALRVARALRAARQQERLAGAPAYRLFLEREAAALDLPSQAVVELAGLSRFRTIPAVTGAARRVAARRLGLERAGSYLPPCAAEAHRVLERHGTPAAAYVFGHTHRAAHEALGGALRPAAYLNTGTWSTAVRGAGPDRADPALFPFVRVATTAADVRAGLHYWHAEARRMVTNDTEYVGRLVRTRVSPDSSSA